MSIINSVRDASIMSIMYSQIHRLSTKNQENEEKGSGQAFCPLLKHSGENQEEQRLVKFYYFAFLLKI
ncbi:hypothetical protein BFP46_01860 [Bacillus licheniformis]|nr:hypothetical protein BFP47_01855 [Bacillus licheniformis]OJT70872.1 hypothetical protein BFP46_01860 [Bacillus licheniformis]